MVDRLTKESSSLAAAATRRMESDLRWVGRLDAADRSWLGVVAQEAIARFTEWLRNPAEASTSPTEIFRAAPRSLARAVTLQQTVAVIRLIVEVVDEESASLVGAEHVAELRDAVLVYSREVAFTAAEVYADAAENRGQWDARLESFAIDAIVRGAPDETLRSRVSTLGWTGKGQVLGIVGHAPIRHATEFLVELRANARALTPDVLIGLQGDKVIVVLGHESAPLDVARKLASSFEEGHVVIGPEVRDISESGRSVRSAIAGVLAVPAWPKAPNPVLADDLLPERMLNGDPLARRLLIEAIYLPLTAAGVTLVETLEEYIGAGHSLEGAARHLFVHPNTVRYRLRRITQLVGWDPTDSREGYVLRTALAVGRLAQAVEPNRAPRNGS
ncbi:MAG TPA: helix-turn-helix domain-containing protein [Actinomycetaceae bacterium]|nr:helix-turn-helix domain-containing protein [Actinomycetaceae bacterium]